MTVSFPLVLMCVLTRRYVCLKTYLSYLWFSGSHVNGNRRPSPRKEARTTTQIYRDTPLKEHYPALLSRSQSCRRVTHSRIRAVDSRLFEKHKTKRMCMCVRVHTCLCGCERPLKGCSNCSHIFFLLSIRHTRNKYITVIDL